MTDLKTKLMKAKGCADVNEPFYEIRVALFDALVEVALAVDKADVDCGYVQDTLSSLEALLTESEGT